MPRQISLIACDAVPPGTSAEVVADGHIYAVYNVDGQFFVLEGICPHAGGPLGNGSLNGSIVTCPWHGWQFDVTSGQNQLNETICQQTFKVFPVDGNVCIEAPKN